MSTAYSQVEKIVSLLKVKYLSLWNCDYAWEEIFSVGKRLFFVWRNECEYFVVLTLMAKLLNTQHGVKVLGLSFMEVSHFHLNWHWTQKYAEFFCSHKNGCFMCFCFPISHCEFCVWSKVFAIAGWVSVTSKTNVLVQFLVSERKKKKDQI